MMDIQLHAARSTNLNMAC